MAGQPHGAEISRRDCSSAERGVQVDDKLLNLIMASARGGDGQHSRRCRECQLNFPYLCLQKPLYSMSSNTTSRLMKNHLSWRPPPAVCKVQGGRRQEPWGPAAGDSGAAERDSCPAGVAAAQEQGPGRPLCALPLAAVRRPVHQPPRGPGHRGMHCLPEGETDAQRPSLDAKHTSSQQFSMDTGKACEIKEPRAVARRCKNCLSSLSSRSNNQPP